MPYKNKDFAYFVDGHAEFKVVQKISPNSIVRRIELNGELVEISAIVNKISVLMKTFRYKPKQVVIVIDREGRSLTAGDMCAELSDRLKALGTPYNLIIGVADRMMENWILADWDNFVRYTGVNKPRPLSIEGDFGKRIIRKLFSRYQETTDGVRLLTSSNISKMSDNSASFRNFKDRIEAVL